MLALLGEVPPDNCQQFIDKGANEKFVYLSLSCRLFVEDSSTPARLWEKSPVGRSFISRDEAKTAYRPIRSLPY
jgi:hypothetical protein